MATAMRIYHAGDLFDFKHLSGPEVIPNQTGARSAGFLRKFSKGCCRNGRTSQLLGMSLQFRQTVFRLNPPVHFLFQSCHQSFDLFITHARRKICSGLADGRQNLMRHPAFECFGFRFPASENQRIEASLADNRHFLIAARGVDNIYSPFIFIQTFIQCVTAVLDFQNVALLPLQFLCRQSAAESLSYHSHWSAKA